MKAALILLLLAGCATKPDFRAPASVEVDRVVAVSCIKSVPVRPNYATEHLAPDATDMDYGDALAADWVRSRGYEGELEAVVEGCK